MTWKDVGSFIGKAAPLLGSVLGGPVGAIAGAAGSLIASALGCENTPEAVEAALAANPDALVKIKAIEAAQQARVLKWQQAQVDARIREEEERTKRAQADMSSDSWLSKNVRPLVLIFLTVVIGAATFCPPELVDPSRYQALQELGIWVYGYYFVGRSTFDKDRVSLHLGKKPKEGAA